jgi:predicted nucleic acid-binding protein
MRFLLDTNVLSEPARKTPDPSVMDWFASVAPLDASISVLTLGEIGKGLSLMAPGPRKESLREWLERDLPFRFKGRVHPVDASVAFHWGELEAEARRVGRPLPVVDGLLLATARAHALTFVTRNVRDCGDRGVPVLDPWRRDRDGPQRDSVSP